MPCMVLIEFGGNDLLQNRPMEETRKALEEIIDYVHGLNAMAVIVDTGWRTSLCTRLPSLRGMP
jgi:lysophospholipase L1-like esterase